MCKTKKSGVKDSHFMDLEYLNLATKHTLHIRQMSVPTQREKKHHWMVGIGHL